MLHLWILLLLWAALPVASARAQDVVTICHATGSPANPYVPMKLDGDGMLEHVNHEEDLVPAPAGGCPTTPVVEPEDTPVPTGTPDYAETAPTATATPAPRATRPRRDDERRDDDAEGAGSGGGGGAPTLTFAAPSAQTAATEGRDLPMTGAEMWLIAAFGVGFLLSGTGLRLLSPAAGRPPGPSGR